MTRAAKQSLANQPSLLLRQTSVQISRSRATQSGGDQQATSGSTLSCVFMVQSRYGCAHNTGKQLRFMFVLFFSFGLAMRFMIHCQEHLWQACRNIRRNYARGSQIRENHAQTRSRMNLGSTSARSDPIQSFNASWMMLDAFRA